MSNGATIGKLKGDLLHWPVSSLQEHIDKINRGFLDGRNGYLICSMYAKSTFSKYKKLRLLNHNSAGK